MIPDRNRIEKSLELSRQYDAAFEYNDFFTPGVYEDKEQVKNRIKFYRSLDRIRKADTLHGVFLDITPHSDDRVIRERSEQLMRQSLETAQELEVRAVIFHTNIIPNFRNENYRNNWKLRNEELIRRLLSEYPGLNIYYENMFDMFPDDLEKLAESLKDEDRFGICFDYAHAGLFGKDADWSGLMPYTKHMHINDNDMHEDLHMAVGAGKTDWRKYESFVRNQANEASVLIETSSLEKFAQSAVYMKENGIYPFPEKR